MEEEGGKTLTEPQLEHVFEPAEMEALHLGQELWGFDSGILAALG